MREIGTIATEKDARALADYLLTLDISTKVIAGRGGFAVWAHREDRVPEAKQVLGDFLLAPEDPRFRSAAPAAKAIRKQAEKEEGAYRKRVSDLRDRWEGAMYRRAPLAFALIVASIVVTALMTVYPPTYPSLAFSIRAVDDEGFVHDTGLDEIRHGQVWRVVTPIFLHFGIFHLFFNMVAMRVFGERVEMRKGPWRFALIVIVAAVAGNVGQFVSSGGGFGGMSGVVFALAAYLWVKGQVQPEDGLSLDNRSFNNMLVWFAAGIVLPLLMPGSRGFPFNMANIAHGAGIAVGVLFGLLRF